MPFCLEIFQAALTNRDHAAVEDQTQHLVALNGAAQPHHRLFLAQGLQFLVESQQPYQVMVGPSIIMGLVGATGDQKERLLNILSSYLTAGLQTGNPAVMLQRFRDVAGPLCSLRKQESIDSVIIILCDNLQRHAKKNPESTQMLCENIIRDGDNTDFVLFAASLYTALALKHALPSPPTRDALVAGRPRLAFP